MFLQDSTLWATLQKVDCLVNSPINIFLKNMENFGTKLCLGVLRCRGKLDHSLPNTKGIMLHFKSVGAAVRLSLSS